MVQVPYRTLYQIENVGDEPALRFEVNVARARKLYPIDETPIPLPGFDYVPTRVTGGRGTLDAQNRPVLDFDKVVAGEERGGAFVERRPQLRERHHRRLPGARNPATKGTSTRRAPSSG